MAICIVCRDEATRSAFEVCDTCTQRLTAYFGPGGGLDFIMVGCREGQPGCISVARYTIRMIRARIDLVKHYFSEKGSRRDLFLHEYNCRHIHEDLYEILGPVTAADLSQWRRELKAERSDL